MAQATASGNAHGWSSTVATGYALVVILLAAVWGFTIAGPVTNTIRQRQEAGLESVAHAAIVALETSSEPANDVLARIASSDDLRLTLIDADGSVAAESTDDQQDMANHAERPEVRAALEGRTGYDQRISETDGHEYLYVAVPASYHDKPVALRVSMPAHQLHGILSHFRWTSLALLSAAVTLATGIAWSSFSRARQPVRRLERVRTDFMANASHELKTPVAGIRLLSESISQASREGDRQALEAFAERLDLESQRLQSLVGDLMDLSRLEDQQRSQLATEGCDLASIVSLALETRRIPAQRAGLELRLEEPPSPQTSYRVRLSATDATLVVDNLLDNALAYTEEGSIVVRLSREGEGAHATAVLSVSDTGIGIPASEQERIFERFYRVDTARSRETGGTGLGLSLVLHAVHRGDGNVSVSSEEGVGSTFTVRLPLA